MMGEGASRKKVFSQGQPKATEQFMRGAEHAADAEAVSRRLWTRTMWMVGMDPRSWEISSVTTAHRLRHR